MRVRGARDRVGRGILVARLRGALDPLRARVANCSVRTAFALYAAAAILAGIALSLVSTGLLGLLAEATLPVDPYAYSGTYVYDAAGNQLVPAEALTWYESSAFDAAIEDGTAGSDTVVLYIESSASLDARSISLEDPPAEVRDETAIDIIWDIDGDMEDASDEALAFLDIAAYDEAARASRPGSAEADALAEQLPPNADGRRPIISNVGYYLPYPGDPEPYRSIANLAVASVPAIFAVCLIVAGRRFYRDRLQPPIEAMDEAARKIASDDLDFTVEAERSDELGRLCEQFETMRGELAESKRALWRSAENRRRVNAAFAHDLRTPLTVIRGQAELIQRLAGDGQTRTAAEAIERHAERLGRYAESMTGIDSLETTELKPEPLDLADWFAHCAEDARDIARERSIEVASQSDGLPAVVLADGQALSHVVENLVANAVRHAKATVELSCAWEDGVLSIAVEDDGDGFGQDALRHAAEPFWRDRAEDPGTADALGTGHLGLGLYICTLICERHGGRLEIGNRACGGSRVAASVSAPDAGAANPPSHCNKLSLS